MLSSWRTISPCSLAQIAREDDGITRLFAVIHLSSDICVTGHPTDTDVALRILNIADGKIRVVVNVVGGAGSDNVPNWAPHGKHFAFVSFQKLP